MFNLKNYLTNREDALQEKRDSQDLKSADDMSKEKLLEGDQKEPEDVIINVKLNKDKKDEPRAIVEKKLEEFEPMKPSYEKDKDYVMNPLVLHVERKKRKIYNKFRKEEDKDLEGTIIQEIRKQDKERPSQLANDQNRLDKLVSKMNDSHFFPALNILQAADSLLFSIFKNASSEKRGLNDAENNFVQFLNAQKMDVLNSHPLSIWKKEVNGYTIEVVANKSAFDIMINGKPQDVGLDTEHEAIEAAEELYENYL
jgi:hypothetical protein